MTTLRSFIAVEIPPVIQQAIQHEIEPLRGALGPGLVRWVACQNLHVTLKFLGDISSETLGMLANMLTLEAGRVQSFPIRVSGLGSFPTPKRARVLWVGLHAPAELSTLQRGIESAAAKLGYAAEARPFSPHLTIGRVRQQATASDQQSIWKTFERSHIGDLGNAEISAVHLYKSELSRGGAVYTKLFSAPLKTS
ncbi:MAG: RNA 2',3'-cyclic phosphodiesterase [Anaerolineales bacterium]|nr:RNA 2',3'-cyclic phosphodiesterase [Anaerolineales bacterium]